MKPFTNKHSHEAREKAALMNDMPIDNRGVGQMNTSALHHESPSGKGHPHDPRSGSGSPRSIPSIKSKSIKIVMPGRPGVGDSKATRTRANSAGNVAANESMANSYKNNRGYLNLSETADARSKASNSYRVASSNMADLNRSAEEGTRQLKNLRKKS